MSEQKLLKVRRNFSFDILGSSFIRDGCVFSHASHVSTDVFRLHLTKLSVIDTDTMNFIEVIEIY